MSNQQDEAIKLATKRLNECRKKMLPHSSAGPVVERIEALLAKNDYSSAVEALQELSKVRRLTVKTLEREIVLESTLDSYVLMVCIPESLLIATSSDDKTVKLWDTENKNCIRTLEGKAQWASTVAFSPDGRLLASGGSNGVIYLWDMLNFPKRKALKGHLDNVKSISFSHDGQFLVSGSWDRSVKLWHLNSGQCITTFDDHKNWVNVVKFSPDGALIASGSTDRTVRIWRVDSGECIALNTEHTYPIRDLVFHPEKALLISGSDDTTIKIWDIDKNRTQRVLTGHKEHVTCLAIHPDGRLLVSGSDDNTIKLWDLNSGACQGTFESSASSLAFSPSGHILAIGHWNGQVQLWDMTNNNIHHFEGHSKAITSVVFGHDTSSLVGESKGDILQNIILQSTVDKEVEMNVEKFVELERDSMEAIWVFEQKAIDRGQQELLEINAERQAYHEKQVVEWNRKEQIRKLIKSAGAEEKKQDAKKIFRNYKEAIQLYTEAANLGSEEGRKRLDELESK